MAKRIIKIPVKRDVIALTSKSRDDWKKHIKKIDGKNVSIKRTKNRDFGLHWRIKYTGKKSVLR